MSGIIFKNIYKRQLIFICGCSLYLMPTISNAALTQRAFIPLDTLTVVAGQDILAMDTCVSLL